MCHQVMTVTKSEWSGVAVAQSGMQTCMTGLEFEGARYLCSTG